MKRLLLLILVSTITSLLYSQVKIEMKKEGGVYKIPCEVNGLKLQFVFDTGASTVSLSSSVAEFMLDHDYLKKEDINGTVKMRQADGTTYDAYKVKLRTINIGGYVLHDVLGVITKNQNTPLLLGQTALEKLGKISVKDNYFYIEKDKPLEYRGAEKDITFLGLNLSSSYNDCYSKLCERYGDSNVLESLTNGAPSLKVKNRMFNNHIFDEILLVFEDGYICFVDLIKRFEKKDLQKALRERDQVLRLYKKKYTAIKNFKSKANGTTAYAIGYEHKSDLSKYPIMLSVYSSVLTTIYHNEDGDEQIQEEYCNLEINYWYENRVKFFQSHDGSDEDDEY